MRDRENKIFIPLLFFVFNVVLRYISIGLNSLAGDEPFSVYFAQMDILDILRHLKPGNNPPLYELLLHYWIKIFGISEIAVRIPSLLFVGVTAAYIYKIGSAFFSRSTGVIAASVFSLSNYATYFAHEARVYAMFGALSAISFYLYLRWLNKDTSTVLLVTNTLVNALLLYAHYFGIMIVGVQGLLAIVFSFKDSKHLIRYGLSTAGVFLFFLPYIPIVVTQFTATQESGTWLQSPQGWSTVEYMLLKFVNARFVMLFTYFVFTTSLVSLIKNRSKITKNHAVIIAWFVVPFFGMFVLSYWLPMFHDRYLMHAFVGFCMLLSIAVTSLVSLPIIKWIVPTLLIVAMSIASRRNIDNGRHTQDAVAKVQEIRTPETRVVLYPNYRILGYGYYFDRDKFESYDAAHAYNDVIESFRQENLYAINKFANAGIDSTINKIIFMMVDGGPKEQLLEQFGQEFKLKNTHLFSDIIEIFELERSKS
mgnify:CR=1 FL=1